MKLTLAYIFIFSLVCSEGETQTSKGAAHPTAATSAPTKSAVSSDFKRTMTAAVDPTSTLLDLQTYTRDARLQMKTSQDRLLFAKLLIAISLGEKRRTDIQTLEEGAIELKSANAMLAIDSDLQANRNRQIDAFYADQFNQKWLPNEIKTCIQEELRIYAEIRKTMGIPAVADPITAQP
jgi:hypothetical protein